MAKISEIEQVHISYLKEYENNAKIHTGEQIEALKRSIKEFGFLAPVLIDGEYNVIAGHGRIAAAKELGRKKVPCVKIDGLDEAHRRAYILADNRLSELGKWNMDLVAGELQGLQCNGLELDLTGFSTDNLKMPKIENNDGRYGDERERTLTTYNLHLIEDADTTKDFWQMPKLRRSDYIPDKLIGFNYAKTSKEKNAGIHFYIDDYQFERVWSYPEKYTDVLGEYSCILTPDFSLYSEMPMPMKIWNIYRSRMIGSYYQNKGFEVIPTISWAEPETFSFCFEGIEKGGIVSVSSIGVKEDKEAGKIWETGMKEMIRKIEPSAILLYGGMVDFNFGNSQVIEFQNDVVERWKQRYN